MKPSNKLDKYRVRYISLQIILTSLFRKRSEIVSVYDGLRSDHGNQNENKDGTLYTQKTSMLSIKK